MGSENATTLRYALTAIADAVGAASDGHVDWAHGFFVGHREGPGQRSKLRQRESATRFLSTQLVR